MYRNTFKRFFATACLNICLVSPLSLSGAIFWDIDTTQPLKCNFSVRHHNRIMVDGGRVSKVIFPEDRLSVRMEEQSGQVFVYAREYIPEETTISVVLQEGHVQDLEIIFSEQPSEVVILKEAEICLCNDAFEVVEPGLEADMLASTVQTILKGEVPEGYFSCLITAETCKLKNGIQMDSISKLVGEDETLYVYQFSNITKYKKTVYESELQGYGSCWVFLERNMLRPRSKMIGIVSVRNI